VKRIKGKAAIGFNFGEGAEHFSGKPAIALVQLLQEVKEEVHERTH